jgi:hypothetical protein
MLSQPRFPRSPFIGTNPMDEPITSGLPVTRSEPWLASLRRLPRRFRHWRTCRFGHATGAITALTFPNRRHQKPLGEKFEDDDLAALVPLSKHIVVADFSRTAITDRSAPIIGGMKRLRILRLMHTRIGDGTELHP